MVYFIYSIIIDFCTKIIEVVVTCEDYLAEQKTCMINLKMYVKIPVRKFYKY